VKKGDEPVYVYPLFTLYGQTPDIVISMRDESKPTPKHLPAYVRKEALKLMPDYEALLRDNDPSAVNGRADDEEDDDPQRDDADEVAVMGEEDVKDIARLAYEAGVEQKQREEEDKPKAKAAKASEAKTKAEAKQPTKKKNRAETRSLSSISSASPSSSCDGSSSLTTQSLSSSPTSDPSTPPSPTSRRSRSRGV
jgi:hypothetical protein